MQKFDFYRKRWYNIITKMRKEEKNSHKLRKFYQKCKQLKI